MSHLQPPPIPPASPSEPPLAENLPTRPTWATVIGILSLIFGGLGVLGGLVGLVMAALQWATNTPTPATGIIFPDWYASIQPVLQGIGALIAALLLLGGVQLIRVRPSARTLLNAYGVATFATTAVSAVGTLGARPDPRFASSVGGLLPVLMAAGFVVSLIYPTFILIWMNRPKIVKQVDQWRAETQRTSGGGLGFDG